MSPLSPLLLAALSSLSAAQFTSVDVPATTSATDTANSFTCDTNVSTNCLQPDYYPTDYYPTDFAYNATATATTTETLAFTEVSTTEYAVATETLYSDGSIDGYYPDNSTDSTDGGNFTETYTETMTNTAGQPVVTTFTETYFDDSTNFSDYTSGIYYNDSGPLIYTFTETTTASNPSGGKPINLIQTVTTTVDFIDAGATGTDMGQTETTASTATGPQLTNAPGNGPIGGEISTGSSSPAGKKRGMKMQRRRRRVRY